MLKIYLLISAVSIVIAATMFACSKSDTQITIEATREAEQTAEAKETATAESEETKARSMIEQYCDAIEARFKTDRQMSTIEVTRMFSAKEWITINADLNSEIVNIVMAFDLDLDRVQNGDYVSWADAFQQSGSKYVGDCATASWKR